MSGHGNQSWCPTCYRWVYPVHLCPHAATPAAEPLVTGAIATFTVVDDVTEIHLTPELRAFLAEYERILRLHGSFCYIPSRLFIGKAQDGAPQGSVPEPHSPTDVAPNGRGDTSIQGEDKDLPTGRP